MSDFAEKARTVAAPRRFGQSNTIVKRDEDTGRVAGKELEHWSGRVDAVAMPDTVRLTVQNGGKR